MVAGTSSTRMMVASTSSATIMPTPISLMNVMPDAENAPTTMIRSRPRLVIRPPVRFRPLATEAVLRKLITTITSHMPFTNVTRDNRRQSG